VLGFIRHLTAMSFRSNPLPRIGLIGVSGYGSIYLQLLRELHDAGKVSVAAAAVINPAEEREVVSELRGRGANIYSSYEEMVSAEAGKIDLCLIPTGIQWHARMTVAALQANMNVLVEKPLAGSLADVAAIRDAERRTGRWVAVGFQDIYAAENLWLKDQLVGGAIGRIESASVIGMWPRPRAYFERNRWAGRLEADGAAVMDSPLNNAFAHFINLSLFLICPARWESSPVQVGEAELYRAHGIETFDTATVRATSPEGVSLWVGVSHSCPDVREPEIHLRGERGRVEWLHERRCVIITSGDVVQVRSLPDTTETRRSMFAAAIARLSDPATLVCGTAMAERHTAFIEQVHQAATVQAFPPNTVRWSKPDGDPTAVPAVEGIEKALDRAMRHQSLLSTTGLFASSLASL
jgi:predicted dehydrogenase